MTNVHDTILTLIREHEDACVRHHEAKQRLEAARAGGPGVVAETAGVAVLTQGAAASATGGRLHGFILGLLVAATARQQHDET